VHREPHTKSEFHPGERIYTTHLIESPKDLREPKEKEGEEPTASTWNETKNWISFFAQLKSLFDECLPVELL
jgi:hypothetical protein